ncbi:MAG: UDP-N-acetylglucosamine--N-acetylmuramyl-(pentapeptide) pyrophosphoryl-undecaprenol N-acetylglucosamine transferase [Planctomycetes bacterium]|nr:UDP-N-acetylglucosamine--N-acetylmuramyl-(pentapeptide) pyrophosphoryl-undecaprenol N-acetylglucosamine transferase [Planctomycetota bacterium]
MKAPTFGFFGGGTGGHIAPGIALAEAIRRASPEAEIAFFPGRRAVETRILDGRPFRSIPLPLSGGGRGVLGRLRLAAGLAVSFARTARWIARTKPRAVVGLGGYGEVAGILAARFLGVPAYLLEQNAIPGRANRVLSPLSAGVFCSFDGTGTRLPMPGRARTTGNPVRAAVLEAARGRRPRDPGEPPRVVIVGGSLGALGLDRAVLAAIPALGGIRPSPRIVHIASDGSRDALRLAYREAGLDAWVGGFRADLPALLAQADLAVARAGGTTIAELAVLGVPAILVPYPHAADGHQSENARRAEGLGFAIRVEESEIATGDLGRRVAALLLDDERLARMAEAARRAARPRAADEIAARLAAARASAGNGGAP